MRSVNLIEYSIKINKIKFSWIRVSHFLPHVFRENFANTKLSIKFRIKFEYEKNFVSSFTKQENTEIISFRIALKPTKETNAPQKLPVLRMIHSFCGKRIKRKTFCIKVFILGKKTHLTYIKIQPFLGYFPSIICSLKILSVITNIFQNFIIIILLKKIWIYNICRCN